ncbi:hypothetical protein ZWY2020_055488 [Hordeum vulgare]|nr:hypothetical protein ZWY2020_055488 [Hordeum vulgare]
MISYPSIGKFKKKSFPLFDSLGELYDGHTAEVCMDGTPAAYHLDPAPGREQELDRQPRGRRVQQREDVQVPDKEPPWLLQLMERQIAFTGIMSASPADNPGPPLSPPPTHSVRSYWALLPGAADLEEAIQHLLSIGMASADRALHRLLRRGAGGDTALRPVRLLRRRSTTVKCLADAGLFLDAVDVSGGRSLRSYYSDIVAMQGWLSTSADLHRSPRRHLGACVLDLVVLLPQNIIDSIKTLSSCLTAYDVWQIEESLALNKADPSRLASLQVQLLGLQCV